ncbi:MAG TPA: Ig-like domain-containing protein, partial [Candidatus Limnocylindrales bacterium]|nr:Ig-like domain-containing protein [Candidatus Limnocylindrales bacterium]
TGLAREGETLFAMDQAGTLTALDISGVQMVTLDTLAVADGGGELFVGGGIAYLASQGARGGFATVDVSDPRDLTLISNSDVAAGFRPDHAVAADGSAHVLVVGNVPDPNNPFRTIDVVDVADSSDPADTDTFLARFVVPEFPLGITLASGVAFIADGDADLLVIGYEPIDTAGQAPDVSISALVDDADPATPGIQVAPDSRIHLLVDATDDVLVRNVEILVDGQPVAHDTSFPYEGLLTASASAGPMTVQARATDTGGNAALSNTLVFEPVTDTVAPTIVAIDPADGASAPEGLQQVTVRFSEALDPATVSASTFRVVTGGQTVAPLGVDLLSESRLVQLRFTGLAAGDYQLVIDADAVTDLAGNTLGAVDVVSDFTLTGEAVTWINPAGGFWDDPANWSGGVLPGPDDNVLIDVPGDVTITHRTGLTVINRLISRESLALTGGTLDVTTTLQVDGAFTLAFSGTGTTLRHATVLPGAGGQDVLLTNFATLDGVTLAADLTVTDLGTANIRNGLTLDGARVTLASDGGPTMLLFDSDQTLGGTGEVFFGGTANENDVDVDGILTIGPGITIRGSQSGGVGHSFGNETIVLEGTVLAETAGETIVIDGNGWENRGLVRATNGGRLELDGTFTLEAGGTFSSASGGGVVLVGTLDNTGRTLALTAATGSLQLDGGTVQGGRVETTGGVALVPQVEMILDGVTLGSDFSVPDGGSVRVRNGLTLDAVTVTLLDGTVPFIGPRIRFDTTETLGGSGDIVFGGTADDGALVAGSGTTLTIGSGITIHGPRGGSVGVLGAVVNQGTISAEVSAREISVTGSSVTNQGTMQALSGGRILFAIGQFTNTGDVLVGAGSTVRVLSGTYLQTAGETSLAGGTLQAATVSIQGGVLSGSGTVSGNLILSGALDVGLGGTAAGQFDRIQVTGAATLGGALNVSLVGGFLPVIGDTFEILTFASRTGDFAAITGLALPNGNTLQYSPEATRIRLITTV